MSTIQSGLIINCLAVGETGWKAERVEKIIPGSGPSCVCVAALEIVAKMETVNIRESS